MKRTMGYRAFTLWELLVVMAMLGVAGLLTAHLFKASMHAIETAPHVQEQQVKLDRMLSVLRRDVWGAERIQASADSVSLTEAGRTIQWKFDKRSTTRSIEGVASADEWMLPFELRASQDGPSLVLQAIGTQDTRRFTSQVLMTAEAK